jgi:PAS domain S-box-containing protein
MAAGLIRSPAAFPSIPEMNDPQRSSGPDGAAGKHPALENAMALLETVFEKAPVGLGVVDRDFRYQRVNPVLAAINGRPAEDHIGRTPAEVVPGIWPAIAEQYEAVLSGETVTNREMSGVIDAGIGGAQTRYWLASYYPVRHEDQIIGIGIVVNDVTELRSYRDRLRVRTELYAMISRTSQAAISQQSVAALYADVCRIAVETGHFRFAWIGVPDDDIIRMVASAGDDSGYMQNLVITLDKDDPRSHGPTGLAIRVGRSTIVNDFHTNSDTAPWHAIARDAGFAASASFPLLEGGVAKAALTLYATTAGFFTPELVETLGEVTPIVSFALDALAAEHAKRRDVAELRLRDRAIRAVSAGICITDPTLPDNPMIFVSPGFERMTGYRSDEVLGRNCRVLQGKDTDPRQLAALRDAIRAGRGCTLELLNYRKDGTPFWNELTVTPVADEHGTLTHFVGVQFDVTERRKFEQQMRQAQKMEAVGQLASGVAHDFNNLLTVIDVCSDLLARSLQQQPDSLELAVEIQKAGERAGTLTRQLLAFSRRQVLAPRHFDLNELVRDSQSLLRRLIGEHILLSIELAPSVEPVMADPGQVEQVLVNLVVNGRDAMPLGGRLTVRTADRYLDAPLGALQPGAHVVLEVTDTGSGMDPAVLSQIFEPFYTTKPAGKGTGLGLATVRSIVEQAAGYVEVESAVGKGTTFRVYLPRDASDADEHVMREVQGSMPAGTETVLLVEDDAAVRSLGQRVLEKCGYTVLSAPDGQAALEFARTYPRHIDLLVSDVVMPILGGRKLAEAVRQLRPDTKVMFVSGYTDDEVLLHGVVHSEVTMLQKPYSLAMFAQTVRRVIDSGG